MSDKPWLSTGSSGSGHVDYDVPEEALRKWAGQCLECVQSGDAERTFRFRFEGSTCMNGGDPFTAELQIRLAREARGMVITEASIAFPAAQMEAAGAMCAFRDRGQVFLDGLRTAPWFCGQTLEEALSRSVPTNPAGCLCTEPMVNHKWRLALCTLHYALNHQE